MMNLVLSNLGPLVTSSFRVNEIASAITIGKVVGSVVSRQTDGAIFDAFAQKYGVRFTSLPPWLEGIRFDRSGVILGSQQREIPCPNTMPGVQLRSIHGIATLMVLITRYVEAPTNIVNLLEELVRGHYLVISGGDLENIVEGNDGAPGAMPYSSKSLLQNFVKAVIDSDARSPQHDRSRQLMGELANVIGRASFQGQTNRHARTQYRKLLRQLLGQQTALPDGPKNIFHTMSGGAAMIALAALANGADVRVICEGPTGTVEIPREERYAYSDLSFTVVLWLREPPSKLAQELGLVGGDDIHSLYPDDSTGSKTSVQVLPIYGGTAEISRAVATKTGCDLSHDLLMELWDLGIRQGTCAAWRVVPTLVNGLRVQLTPKMLECVVPRHMERQLNEVYPKTSERHELARVAAAILHQVANYSDYESLGAAWFRIAIQHVLVSYAVGCLKSLVSTGRELLSHYCWTTYCGLDENGFHYDPTGSRNIINLSKNLLWEGISIQDCLWVMACVWGGSTPEHHSHVNVVSQDRIVGIAAPQLTFLSDVLRTPRELASRGLAGGFISVHAGSIPVLPRDGPSNLVIAADLGLANSKRNYVFGRGPRQLPEDDTAEILFSIEPYIGQGRSHCALLCAWQYGQVLCELDPMTVLGNLIADRKLASSHRTRPGAQFTPPSNLQHCFVPVRCGELPILQSSTPEVMRHFKQALTAVVRAEGRTDWQVVAAGSVKLGSIIMASVDGESLEEMLTSGLLDPNSCHNRVVVVCRDNTLPSIYTELESQYSTVAARQSREEFHFVDFNLTAGIATWKVNSVVMPIPMSYW